MHVYYSEINIFIQRKIYFEIILTFFLIYLSIYFEII